jgi:lipopolysaccharide biosynthesis regulator YciM
VLALDGANVQALVGIQTLQEEQRQWKDAYETRARLAQLRKTDDRVVLAHLQAAMGLDALAAGQREAAEGAFRAAIALDPRVLPAQLGLADLVAPSDPRRAATLLEDAVRADPDRGTSPSTVCRRSTRGAASPRASWSCARS